MSTDILREHLDALSAALSLWETRDDSRPQPEIRQAANAAMDAIDVMLRELHAMRSRLVGEIRDADDDAAARADELLRGNLTRHPAPPARRSITICPDFATVTRRTTPVLLGPPHARLGAKQLRHQGRGKEVKHVGHKPHERGSSGWVQVIVSLAIATAAAAGAGHNSQPSPRPPTVCVSTYGSS